MKKDPTIEDVALEIDESSKPSARGWHKYDFQFGANFAKVVGESGDNTKGDTPDRDRLGRPRALDFEHYSSVDWSLNDDSEDYS